MAVPPVSQARTAAAVRAVRVPLLLDVVAGLLIMVALPLAVVAIPNTISVVAALLPPGVSHVDMMRAHGLALPAMLLTVPLAAVAVRRFRAAPILVAGLALLAVADAAGGYANSTGLVGVLRVLHGLGAGALIPATLVVVWERPRRNVLLPLWAGMLTVSLLSAQALALHPLADLAGPDSWRVTLQPYPLPTGVALVLAAAYLVLWLIEGAGDGGSSYGETRVAESAGAGASTVGSVGASPAERRQLMLAVVPAAGIAALGIFLTFDWPPVLVIVVAAVAAAAVLAMLGLGAIGTIEGPGGRTLAFVNVAIGLVVLPTAAQTTYLELGGLGGPGLKGLWLPFLIAAFIALAAAVIVGGLPERKVTTFPAVGMVAMVAGLCAIWWIVPEPSGWPLVAPFTLLAAGSAVALVSAFRLAGIGSALLGLSMCFPALLAGFLLGTGIQVLVLDLISRSGSATGEAVANGFVDALHKWALVGGGVVVGIILLAQFLARRASALPEASLAAGTASAATTDSAGERRFGGQDTQVMIPAPTPSPEGEKGTAGHVDGDR
ncbi:hypothetical protein [Sphaerimonospora thailandensis]|uniref:Uncharacterized protein n=1 Tax=Sphaerimonospora thailandensis TaxID=795644 RepID=A0A8J3VYM7_9ACTN|nr:hypothetical protein [Sphaerimonospora thailandensis]GIH70219.1 hypothetical protein Mth01_24720 [Sphaerimonospora thailandensis]